MKKTIKILLLAVIMTAIVFSTKGVFATTTGEYENLTFEMSNNQITITGYKGNITDVVIPSEIDDYPVTAISDNAFSNCKTLKSIKLSDSINKLGEAIFMYCESLSDVTLPKNIKTIPSNLFCGCTNLTNVTIPAGVTKIDGGAFDGSGVIDVIIPNTVTEIWYGVFSDCPNLKTVTIPSSVTFLGDDGNGDELFVWDMEGEPLKNRITLYVEKGSYAEEYAKKENIKYVITNSSEDTKTPISLSNNEIKIESTTNVIPENTKLLVKEVTTGNNYNIVSQALETDVNKFVLYDISLESNNAKIQPNGKVKISIPVPNGFDKSNISVYRVEDNGNKIEYATKIEKMEGKEYAVFETDHFSNYVIAEKTTKVEQSQETQKQENLQHKLDNEPKTGIINVVSIVSVIVAVSLIGFTVCKQKMYK